MMNNEDKILSILEKQGATIEKQGEMLEAVIAEQRTTNQRLDKLKHDVQEINRRTIIIENDYGKRIDAALDGYSALYDISNEIRSDIRKIYGQQDRQDAYITVFESERRKSK